MTNQETTAPATAHPRKPRPLVSTFGAPVVLLALATAVFFWPLLSGTRNVPGDFGDSRFNIFVLEHVFRWLTGSEASLFSPGIFFPYPLTLAFSDMHFGTEIFYAAFRLAGFDPYDAFNLWFVLGYVLTFLASYWVLLRMIKAPWLAAIGAFAFAFCLPSITQMGHAQLVYRVGVPFAVLFALRYAERKLPADFYGLVAAVSLQMLINVYLGLYALMIAAIVFLASLLATEPRSFRTPIALLSSFLAPMRVRQNHPPLRIALAVVLFVAAVAMLGVHAYAGHVYELRRSWWTIATMVPRPWSYLMMDWLNYWTPLSRALPDVPVRGEHQLFLGLPTVLLFLMAGAATFWRPASTPIGTRIQVFATLITLAVMTTFGPLTLYIFVAQLPGYDALRAASRIGIVGAFTVVAAITLFLAGDQLRGRWKAIIAAGFVVWMAFDLTQFNRYSFSSAEARQRIAALTAKIDRSTLTDKSVLALVGDPASAPWANQIDAMLVAQSLGIATFNGYSGNFVPGYRLETSCDGFVAQLQTYAGWARDHGYPALTEIDYEPVVVGAENCDLLEVRDWPIILDQPLTAEETAQHVSLSQPRVVRDIEALTVTVTIRNDSDAVVLTHGDHPLRLSWRFPEAFDSSTAGWENRIEIGADLQPGASRDVSFKVPVKLIGTWRQIQVAFVEEFRFWAHDFGVLPLDVSLEEAE